MRKERRRGVGRGEEDGGEVCARGGTEKDCSDMVGVRRVSDGPFGTVQWNPIERPGASNS